MYVSLFSCHFICNIVHHINVADAYSPVYVALAHIYTIRFWVASMYVHFLTREQLTIYTHTQVELCALLVLFCLYAIE